MNGVSRAFPDITSQPFQQKKNKPQLPTVPKEPG